MGEHACTLTTHRWVCSTNLSSMMSPEGVGSALGQVKADHPQTDDLLSKILSNSAKSLSFVSNLLNKYYFLRARTYDGAEAFKVEESLFPVTCALWHR